ncbi:hypothetical protein [Herbaspirillum rubrisubalbicans]|uniref:DUF2214 domain-containing protein n=1 Tax=Herbaspirillum rubrisubalbicans Os34 TaxID=1235827 RepID=A0A6M3ZRT2_9BURK|nr:hypothetical protein [Herbaspirillum rubrisubalbicans]QJQ01071.1 hypothetical protein C798_12745 [Herbaspirillum rubrisubalbicans Os34]
MKLFLDVTRIAMIYLHIISMLAAAVSIVMLDFLVFKERGYVFLAQMIHKLATIVLIALLGLWVTGLTVIGVDTGFDPNIIAHNGKLLAKLAVVTILSINGIAVHLYVLPRLAHTDQRVAMLDMFTLSIGVVSAVSWGYAAFLGIAKALTPHLGLSGFIGLYLLAIACAWIIVVTIIRPRLLKLRQLPERRAVLS